MGSNTIYPGMGYGLDYDQQSSLGFNYKNAPRMGEFGIPTDPRLANQLQAVSAKLATGAKSVEISAVQPEVFEYIPKQQFEEIRRLKKLVGSEITFHGPLVEATGITQQGWDESNRMQAERKLFDAVEKANMVGKNTVFTVHSTSGLPEMRTRVIDEPGKEKVTELWVIDERDKKFSAIKLPEKNYLTKKQSTIQEELKSMNKENWTKLLTQVSFHAHQGQSAIDQALKIASKEDNKNKVSEEDMLDLYKAYKKGGDSVKQIESSFNPDQKKLANSIINNINYGEIYVQDAYQELQTLYNKAYLSAEKAGDKGKEDLKRLDEFREKIAPIIAKKDDPNNLNKFAEEVTNGVRLLSSLSQTPEILKPLNEFAIEKAAETYAGVAVKAYKKFGDNAPIISIENPPAGSGLSRADDLRNLVEASRTAFARKLADDKNISEKEASKIAEKFIGVTWDVGHINMIRKFGYDDKAIIEETKKIAPYVKHVHLSDNFGLEHTELPMGMGNVPVKPMLDAISEYNKQIKKVIETGGWYQHFKKSPLTETFQAFGSQTYGSAIPSWVNAYDSSGGYFAGRGMNPDFHHSIYGAGFTTLPIELGGQMTGRNRLSGSPMEG